MYPPFWFSMLKYKMATLILLEGKYLKIYSRKPHHIFQMSHMISTLDSLASNMEGHAKLKIDSPVPLTDSFIVSHTLLRNRHRPNQTSCVSFASEYTVSIFAILASAKRPLPSSTVLLKYLLGSKGSIQTADFQQPPRKRINMHYVSQHVVTHSPARGDCVWGVHEFGQWVEGSLEKLRAEICWGP